MAFFFDSNGSYSGFSTGCLGATIITALKLFLIAFVVLCVYYLYASGFNWLVDISTSIGYLIVLIILGVATVVAIIYLILNWFEKELLFKALGLLVAFLLLLFLRIGAKNETIHKIDLDTEKQEVLEVPNAEGEEATLELSK